MPVSTLQEIATSQGLTFQPGDILFIRTGWTRAYSALSQSSKISIASHASPPSIGLESSKETLRWIWENKFAACAGDQPAFEAWPCDGLEVTLHEWMLAGWGCPIGELFDLERLSEECRKRKRYTFFFGSMPLNVSHAPSSGRRSRRLT
jgi:kynurenine formamidase